MDSLATQLGLFGESTTYFINKRALKFCVKKHKAEQAGLHYDVRLQFNDLLLKSFAVKPGPSMNPKIIADAVLVDDHEMGAFRREGTILNGSGLGPVIQFDEGYYTIPGVQNLKELRKGLEDGLAKGDLKIIFDGYKIKGAFNLCRKPGKDGSKWTIQKAHDDFATEGDVLLQDKSILTENTIEHYLELYEKQKLILNGLDPIERTKFIKDNNGDSFKYNRFQLPPRPNKLLPYD